MTDRTERVRTLLRAEEEARRRMLEGVTALAEEGMPRLEARGKLIRPVVATAGLGGGEAPAGFASALAAIQLAHEASLVHDDIVDRAAERRGAPSVVAHRGVARALVHGDHLLTTAYRAAAATGSLAFAAAFARAVERTVAGEVRQAGVAGQRIDETEQRAIAEGKSGELFGCALAAAALLRGDPDAERIAACGRAFGVVYQRVDDLYDYLPAATTGKPALADYRQRHWTWPLDLTDVTGFEADPANVAAKLDVADADGVTPLDRALRRIDDDVERVRAEIRASVGASPVLDALLDRWRTGLRAATEPAPDVSRVAVPSVAVPWPEAPADADAWMTALARGSRSFRFAARLFPAADRRRIAGVYSFCRYTDDLVDRAEGLSTDEVEARLEAWVSLARRAYDGESTGIGLLDGVMADSARSGVPFRYVWELIEGMRMDLRPRTYADLGELRTYTYRVASVVGLWLTELHDVRDEAVLERAATMGHAMQLTNILRDVGEDLEAGRLYVPLEVLAGHGLDRSDLERMRRDGRIDPAWRDLVEELMAVADGWYREAFAALPALPRSFQRPVAVAAWIYRGIHDGIRRNGYDNLRRRAWTTVPEKASLGVRALFELRRARRRGVFRPPVRPGVPQLAGAVAAEGPPEAAAR